MCTGVWWLERADSDEQDLGEQELGVTGIPCSKNALTPGASGAATQRRRSVLMS